MAYICVKYTYRTIIFSAVFSTIFPGAILDAVLNQGKESRTPFYSILKLNILYTVMNTLGRRNSRGSDVSRRRENGNLMLQRGKKD